MKAAIKYLVPYLLAVSTIAVSADEFPQVTVKKNALVCYEREDWKGLIAESLDGNEAGAQAYFTAGKCVSLKKNTTVSFLDPVTGGAALIMLPSGRTAFTYDEYIER